MDRRRLAPIVLAVTGCAGLVAGVWLLAGLGWALIAAGAVSVAAGVLLYDPAPPLGLPREFTTGQKPMVMR